MIFDTTLRDGEQCPGATMTFEEKLQVAELLDEMGVDIIEAGFPIASEGDFEAVNEIAKLAKNVGGLRLGARQLLPISTARARPSSRPSAAASTPSSERRRSTASSSSGSIRSRCYERVIASVTRARGFTDDVEWSAMDATRTERDYLCRVVEAAIKAGATTINIPDTVGYATPEEYFELITMLKTRVPGMDKIVISTHCHDDLGLAVANSLAGIRAGARQIECTINGLGERAGNAALEEVVMAIRTRHDLLPFKTGIKTRNAVAGVEARFRRDQFPGAVQQGDRRPERLRARERHSPGRRDEAHRHLRDHDARERRRRQILAGHG